MTTLIVKLGQIIGKMNSNVPQMREGGKLYLDGQHWEVTGVMHFIDIEGVKEYAKFKAPFTRYLISPIIFKT